MANIYNNNDRKPVSVNEPTHTDTRRLYEVWAQNINVIKCMEDGQDHPFLSESWASITAFEYHALSAEHAKSMFYAQHPKSQGYFVESVIDLTPVYE